MLRDMVEHSLTNILCTFKRKATLTDRNCTQNSLNADTHTQILASAAESPPQNHVSVYRLEKWILYILWVIFSCISTRTNTCIATTKATKTQMLEYIFKL